VTLHTRSPEETEALGAALGAACRGGEVIRVSGELGAGKTRLAKGLGRGLGIPADEVTSPTFTLMALHRGRLPFYHVDLYRLADPAELAPLGLFEEPEGPGVTLIEWPAQGGAWVPVDALEIRIGDAADGGRVVTLADPAGVCPHLLEAAAAFASP
jgi:tRNA threonylcarbamoyladenosine biosynthesis protein TsaE